MTQEELDKWEQETLFKSYRSILVDADKEWAALDSEEKKPAFLAKYKDVLNIEDGALVPHIKIFMYQSIINREGVYRTGDHYHKVIGDFIVTVKKEDYYKFNSIKLVNDKPLEAEGLRVYQYISNNKDKTINSKTQATCSSDQYFKQAEYYLNSSRCRDQRKAFISARSYVSLYVGYGDFNGTWRYGDFYQSAVEIRVWGTIRNWLCSWNNYSTQLEWRSISYRTVGYVTTGYEANRTLNTTQQFTLTAPNFDSVSDVSYIQSQFKHGDIQFNNPIMSWPLLSIYAEGKSRGIGNNWAVIYCP